MSQAAARWQWVGGLGNAIFLPVNYINPTYKIPHSLARMFVSGNDRIWDATAAPAYRRDLLIITEKRAGAFLTK
jgi:hypothetical protein